MEVMARQSGMLSIASTPFTWAQFFHLGSCCLVSSTLCVVVESATGWGLCICQAPCYVSSFGSSASIAEGQCNSAVHGLIELKFEIIQAFMVVLVTCKNDKDPSKNEG